MADDVPDEIAFSGEVIEWRGPAPFYFVVMSADDALALRSTAKRASYGWGCVAVVAKIKETEFQTSLMPRNGSYLLPLKATVRRMLEVAPGDRVEAVMHIPPQ